MSIMPFVTSLIANLMRRPVTRTFPFTNRPPFERTRGSVAIVIENCIYCGQCSRKCPSHAIETSRSEAFWQINRLRCIQCGACVDCCPKKCLRMANEQPVSSTGSQIERMQIPPAAADVTVQPNA